MLNAGWIGQGTFYLLAKRRIANVALAIIVGVSLIGAYGVIVLPLDPTEFSTDVSLAESFREIMPDGTWVRKITPLFNIYGLFALVGGLEKTHILEMLANSMKPLFLDNFALGAAILYWVTVPIVGLVEHDAYILTFLYTIRDLGEAGVPTWPLWWMIVWSGTLGSNLTIAGAPALYVALTIIEKEEGRKISLREFLSWSVPFALVSSAICFVLGMLIWVLPAVP